MTIHTNTIKSEPIFRASLPKNYKREDKTATFMRRIGLEKLVRWIIQPASRRAITLPNGKIESKFTSKDLASFSRLMVPYAIIAAILLPILGVCLMLSSPFIAEKDEIFSRSKNAASMFITGLTALFTPILAAIVIVGSVTGLLYLVGYLLSHSHAIPAAEFTVPEDEREITLKTPDRVCLSAYYRDAYAEADDSDAPARATLYLSGNGGSWEEADVTIAPHTDLLMLNPRGVGRSQGVSSPEKLALDAFTAFEYLVHEKGFDPENITIYGWSLGGGYGALATQIIREKYPDKKLKILSERSFSKLSSVAKTAGGICYGWLFSKLVIAAGWEIDAANALKTLKNKEVVATFSPSDNVIPKAAALAHAIIGGDTSIKVIALETDDSSKKTHSLALEHFEEPGKNAVFGFLGYIPEED